MSPSADQSAYAAPVIQELLDWVPRHSIPGTRGPSAKPNCPFMPHQDLEKYLKSDRRTSRLLRAIYFGREHSVVVETLEKRCIRAFTILILIGKGEYIEHFIQHPSLQDHPLAFLEKPAHFPIDPSDPHFWDKYYEKQFTFYPHNFRLNDNYILDDSYVLPIVSKDLLGSGGSAAIYKIVLHPFYDELGAVPGTSDKPALGHRPANTYVLKTYNTSDAQRYYENEVEAFKKIASKDREDKSIIQFLGSYNQGDTYNILLEYADRLTLQEFFRDVPPPTLGEDIALFWQRLFNLLKALSCIHTIERPDGLTGPDILIGWHQDVKPSNILVLSGDSSHLYDVHFKLADLGLSHFKRTEKLSGIIADSDVGGTKDYGAPECYRSDDFLARAKVEVQPLVDIWSLGGIYSEAATWVVLGKAGLSEYRKQRQQEVAGKNTSQDGTPFHDGQMTLETVEQMHERLLTDEGEARPGDHITKPVIKDMVSSMLIDDPYGRENAIALWKTSQKILVKGQKQLEKIGQQQSPPIVENAVSNLQAFDQRASETSLEVSSRAAEQPNGPSHMHGPPPFDPRYSSSLRSNSQSSSPQQLPKQRSDTWHDPSSTREIASGLHIIGHSSPTKPNRQSLSFAEAKKIREKRAVLPDQATQLLNKLKNRDHVFLVDDSLSMKKHWDSVIDLFSVFAWHTKSLDSNGLEMYFTVSLKKGKFKNTTRAVEILKSISQSIPSNIDLSLGEILREYQGKLERQKNMISFWPREKSVKPLSLYVFTDGAWEGCDAVAPIEAMIEKQKELKLPREQIGIQFIRFGDDPRGVDRLHYLDAGLREKHGKEHDHVDSEPFIGGNVLKMFLGPIFNWYDGDEPD